MPKVSLHWVLYGLLVVGGLFLVHVWRDTQVKDAAIMASLKADLATKAATDKAAQVQSKQIETTLQTTKQTIQKRAVAANTTSKQVGLINQEIGSHIEPLPQAKTPLPDSPVAQLNADDTKKLVDLTVAKDECVAQVAADTLQQGLLQSQVAAGDKVITDQGVEITNLKGGSHFKRFLKILKYTGIGAAAGAVTVELLNH
jgi:hypothetical protein